MPTYFFHVRDGKELNRDTAGVDLRDVAQARTTAINYIRKVLAQRFMDDCLLDERSVAVADAKGNIVLEVRFSEVFESSGQANRAGRLPLRAAPPS